MVMLLATRVHFYNFLKQANRDIKVQKEKKSMRTHIVFQLYTRLRGMKGRMSGYVSCLHIAVLAGVCKCV